VPARWLSPGAENRAMPDTILEAMQLVLELVEAGVLI
jgi:hypothetical protein